MKFLWTFKDLLIFPKLRAKTVNTDFVRSFSDFCGFWSRFFCVHVQTFVSSCPEFHAIISRFPRVYFQTFVLSCPDLRAFMSKFLSVHVQILCVHPIFSCSPDFRAFMTWLLCVHFQISCVQQIFLCSPNFCLLMFRYSFVDLIFVRSCSDFYAITRLSCVYVQTFVRFSLFPD